MIRRFLRCLLVGLALAGAPGARADFAPYAEQHELKPLYPARPNFGSGTVFQLQRSADGSRYVRVLCRNLFAAVDSVRAPIMLKTTRYADPERFSEALGIVYGLLSSAHQAAENLQTQKVSSIALSYKEAEIERLPSTIKLTQAGAAFALDPTCLATLARLKREGSFEEIHVVDRALRVNRFGIEIERPPTHTLDVIEVLGVDREHKFQSKGMNAVEIDAPYYIGMNPLKIVDIEPASPDAKPDTRVVKVAPAKLPERFRAWE